MATTVTVNSNYAGKEAGDIIGASFKEADTLSSGFVTVYADIDYQISIRKKAYANGRTDYTCGFTPQGAVTLSEKILAPKKIKNELEICKEDLRQIWSSATMGFSAHNDNMPQDVESALLAEIGADGASVTDDNIWQGDATNDGEFDGFIKAFTADASLVKNGNGVANLAVPAAITSANVLEFMQNTVAAIPVALRRKSLGFGVSPDVADAWSQYLISNGLSNGLGGDANTALVYGRYTLTEIGGLPDNTAVVAESKNLVFGTGLLSDHNEVRIKDMDESDLSGQVRYKEVFTAGVQYANSEDIVWNVSTSA